MRINADFAQRAVVHAAHEPWVPSPMAGVERRLLDRIGGEVARATSIVRYAPGSHFSAHVHDGGEEFLVLEGTFQDEHGDYPTGTYVRNPPTSRHTPRADAGCVIFVKLWQFDLDDRTEVRLDPARVPSTPEPARPGVAIRALHRDAREAVAVEDWAAGTEVDIALPGGLEMLVLDGDLDEGDEHLTPWSWLRLPAGGRLRARAGPRGARVWVKRGHLTGAIRAPGG
ncbi:MAG: cupin domain-containing protein [Ectothiorhodospiraceae bacterium]|nr:cupin domain-containing protein [Ectothiorhodospiraceae bacterium]